MPKVWAAVLLVVSLLPQPAWAITLEQVPNPRRQYGGWVSDTANILSSSTENELNRLITQLEQRTSAEMAVVTVPNTQGYATPKDFTTQLFNYWGIGKAGQNNGVLFLISVGDRRVEIETGTGLTTILPNSRVQQIIDRQILPKFRDGDFDGGTLAGVRQLTSVLQGQPVANVPAAASGVTTSTIATSSGAVAQGIDSSLVEGILLLLGIIILGLGWQRSRMPVSLRAERGGRQVLSLTPRDQGTGAALSSVQSGPIRLFLYSGSLCLGLFLGLSSGTWLGFALPVVAALATDGTLGLKRGIPFQPVVCQACGRPMRPIQPEVLNKRLYQPDRLAKSSGRAQYYGWFCPACQGVAVVVRESPSYRDHYCPRCRALTLDLSTEILVEATYSQSGLKREIFSCPLCSYRTEREVVIPKLSHTSDRDTRDWHTSDRDTSDWHTNDSSRDSDFGGGSSIGGGAGGSW
ncbi:TPM domain-containing protein [Synechococcus sp. W55.1]|uniref:TPM domain-containing protein n=1 Tax=Synechococcus sp. W55.1 TaxID=2964512 RepID=UPI0039C30CEC